MAFAPFISRTTLKRAFTSGAFLAAGYYLTSHSQAHHSQERTFFPFARSAADANLKRDSLSRNFVADAVEKTLPSLVQIISTPESSGSFFNQVFSSPSAGSGFFISKSGRILTNAHVVGNRNSVLVNLSDGKTVNARVIGVDSVTDIALLQAEIKQSDPDEIIPAELGDSDEI